MMEKGYYKPEIEEFCVGLELKLQNIENGMWGKYIVKETDSAFDFIEDGDLENEFVLVKFLDREDIYSELFVTDVKESGTIFGIKPYTGKTTNKNKLYEQVVLQYTPHDNWMYIALGGSETSWQDENVLFQGKIRNRTEFKKLLKQVGV